MKNKSFVVSGNWTVKELSLLCPCRDGIWNAERRYPLNRRLGGPQSWSGRFGEDEILLPLLVVEPRADWGVLVSKVIFLAFENAVSTSTRKYRKRNVLLFV
jgi:hypothetical protein